MAEQVRQDIVTTFEINFETGVTKMREHDIRKLPKWAQNYIRDLQNRVAAREDTIADLVERGALQDKGSDEAESPVSSISYEGGAGDP